VDYASKEVVKVAVSTILFPLAAYVLSVSILIFGIYYVVREVVNAL